MLACSALVVEGHNALGRTAHVRHDEPDARIKFSGMPFHFGDHPPWLGPASGLVGEIGVEPPDLIWRSSDRTLEQVADPRLENLVGRQADELEAIAIESKRTIDIDEFVPRKEIDEL